MPTNAQRLNKAANNAGGVPPGKQANSGTKNFFNKIGQTFTSIASIDPKFRQKKALRSAEINRLQLDAQIKEEEFRRDSIIIPLEQVTSNMGPRGSKRIIDTLTREGFVVEENGVKGVRFGQAQERLQKLLDEPDEQLQLTNDQIQDKNDQIAKTTARRNELVKVLAKKRTKTTSAEGSEVSNLALQKLEAEIKNGIVSGTEVDEINLATQGLQQFGQELIQFQQAAATFQREIDTQQTALIKEENNIQLEQDFQGDVDEAARQIQLNSKDKEKVVAQLRQTYAGTRFESQINNIFGVTRGGKTGSSADQVLDAQALFTDTNFKR